MPDGLEDTFLQKIYVDNMATPVTSVESRSYYADLKAAFKGFHAHFSYAAGRQGIANYSDHKYDFNLFDSKIEYVYENDEKTFFLKPELSSKIIAYNGAFLGGSEMISNIALSLLADGKIGEHLRLLGAVRGDKYNHPEDLYFSYQFAVMIPFTRNHMIRFGTSRANRAPFMMDLYANVQVTMLEGPGEFLGDPELKLMTLHGFEAGYRYFLKHFYIDIEGFYQILNNFIELAATEPSVLRPEGGRSQLYTPFQFRNYDKKVYLMGEPSPSGGVCGVIDLIISSFLPDSEQRLTVKRCMRLIWRQHPASTGDSGLH